MELEDSRQLRGVIHQGLHRARRQGSKGIVHRREDREGAIGLERLDQSRRLNCGDEG